MSLALKYRPQTFEEVVGQQNPIAALRGILKRPLQQQAYIFTGSRGTGKTTTARIFGKTLNCAKGPTADLCGNCPSCLSKAVDILEVDAASNSSINDIRELKRKFYTKPLLGRYRIYILDEVHMFSAQAFDLLLKTLEEPPSHAMFIMATTELDEIPNTIQSRSHVYHFELIPEEVIIERLKVICSKENITLSDKSLTLIARQAEGSMRDAITLTSRFIDDPSDEVVVNQIGIMPFAQLEELVNAVKNNDSKTVFKLTDSFEGDWMTTWNEFLRYFQADLELNWSKDAFLANSSKLAFLRSRTMDIKYSGVPKTVIQLSLGV